MQAQRYGTLPIAHAVGGLVDTIEDGVTGLLFSDLTVGGLARACERAFDVFADRGKLDTMRRAAMGRNFSWSASADAYAAIYRRHCGAAELRPMARPTAVPRCVRLERGVGVELEAAA
jgi:starch synthase